MDDALILCRLLHFATSLCVFGILVFQAALCPLMLAVHLEPRLRRLMIWGSVIAAATSVLWLVLLAALMADDWSGAISDDVLGEVLFGTEFGHVWQWHTALSLLLVAAIWLDRRLPQPVGRIVALILSALQLATLGLVGHAVMASGWSGLVNRAALGLHLLAGGYWLGCLVPVMMCLSLNAPDLHHDAITALRRFSNVGHAAVALVIATGVINMDLIVGTLSPAFTNAYQDLLAAKILVVAAMTLLAILNRYYLVPRLRQAPWVLDQVQRVFAAVYALGLGAIALVSVFGTLAPT
jgi:putative copper resistance protein D